MFDPTKLCYSYAFDEQPNYEEYQINAEEAIAASLFDDWTEYSFAEHAREIVASIAEAFGEDPGVWTATPGLLADVEEQLCLFSETFSTFEDGPDEDEAREAGKVLCLFCFSVVLPKYVMEREK